MAWTQPKHECCGTIITAAMFNDMVEEVNREIVQSRTIDEEGARLRAAVREIRQRPKSHHADDLRVSL